MFIYWFVNFVQTSPTLQKRPNEGDPYLMEKRHSISMRCDLCRHLGPVPSPSELKVRWASGCFGLVKLIYFLFIHNVCIIHILTSLQMLPI